MASQMTIERQRSEVELWVYKDLLSTRHLSFIIITHLQAIATSQTTFLNIASKSSTLQQQTRKHLQTTMPKYVNNNTHSHESDPLPCTSVSLSSSIQQEYSPLGPVSLPLPLCSLHPFCLPPRISTFFFFFSSLLLSKKYPILISFFLFQVMFATRMCPGCGRYVIAGKRCGTCGAQN